MNTLVDAKLMTVARNANMLSFMLAWPDMLSTTGYKVLQRQQSPGLLPCYRVVFNGYNKLDYDAEGYHDLASLLPYLPADRFLFYVNGMLGIISGLGQGGFLQPANLIFSLDMVFVDQNDSSVHMVYLPLSDKYDANRPASYINGLKQALWAAVQSSPVLQSQVDIRLQNLLCNEFSTLDHLTTMLGGLVPRSAPVTSRVPSGFMPPPPAEIPVPPPGPPREKRPIWRRCKKTQKRQEALPIAENVWTEVLGAVFVPTILLDGETNKDKFVVDKQDFMIGKRTTGVDHVIEYSSAVSRVHCKISANGGRNYITDLGSSNGTYVNGHRLNADEPTPVNAGDRIKLGNVSFVVREV